MSPPSGPLPPTIQVLVVADDEVLGRAIRAALQAEPRTAVTSGRAADAHAVVLGLDPGAPGWLGHLDAARPVIAVVGGATHDDVARLVFAGADEVIDRADVAGEIVPAVVRAAARASRRRRADRRDVASGLARAYRDLVLRSVEVAEMKDPEGERWLQQSVRVLALRAHRLGLSGRDLVALHVDGLRALLADAPARRGPLLQREGQLVLIELLAELFDLSVLGAGVRDGDRVDDVAALA